MYAGLGGPAVYKSVKKLCHHKSSLHIKEQSNHMNTKKNFESVPHKLCPRTRVDVVRAIGRGA